MKKYLFSALCAASLGLGPGIASASAKHILFIMDSSNSMWGQLDGVAKMEIAKDAMENLLSDLPAETQLGLMAYGHRAQGDCSDVELLNPLGTDPAAVIQAMQGLQPKGKTPIAASLQASAQAFDGLEGSKNVVLISDGIETCEGEPCGAAEALAKAGVDVRVHVVGFDLSAEERKELECIAEKGKGQYFEAKSTEGFSSAVSEALNVVEESSALEEEPVIELAQTDTTVSDAEPEPVRELVWSEEFEGFDLSEEWTVLGPNPDNYVTEEGQLLILSSRDNAFQNPEAENIVQWLGKFPRGDWDIETTFYAEFQTGADAVSFGLRKDESNFLTAVLWANGGYCSEMSLRLRKRANGENTDFDSRMWYNCGDGTWPAMQAERTDFLANEGAVLTISKRGRSYYASIRINGVKGENGQPLVWTTEQLTSLRSPGDLAISVSKWNAENQGELLLFVEKIEIFSVN